MKYNTSLENADSSNLLLIIPIINKRDNINNNYRLSYFLSNSIYLKSTKGKKCQFNDCEITILLIYVKKLQNYRPIYKS